MSLTEDDDKSPEALSIKDILRKKNRERLIVHPLQWTMRQLQILECEFYRCTDPTPPIPTGSGQDGEKSPDCKKLQDRVKNQDCENSLDCEQCHDAERGEPQQEQQQEQPQQDGLQPPPPPEDLHVEAIHQAIDHLRHPSIPEFRASTVKYLLLDYGVHRFRQVILGILHENPTTS